MVNRQMHKRTGLVNYPQLTQQDKRGDHEHIAILNQLKR